MNLNLGTWLNFCASSSSPWYCFYLLLLHVCSMATSAGVCLDEIWGCKSGKRKTPKHHVFLYFPLLIDLANSSKLLLSAVLIEAVFI